MLPLRKTIPIPGTASASQTGGVSRDCPSPNPQAAKVVACFLTGSYGRIVYTVHSSAEKAPDLAVSGQGPLQAVVGAEPRCAETLNGLLIVEMHVGFGVYCVWIHSAEQIQAEGLTRPDWDTAIITVPLGIWPSRRDGNVLQHYALFTNKGQAHGSGS